jgi:hypothetical protein
VSPLLDVSDDVRAEIGEEEATRLLAGETAPDSYDCTSCRTPGDTDQERTSTVLFIGDETAVLAFAHATCVPSQIVKVSEEQIRGAVRTITSDPLTSGPRAIATTGAVPGTRQAVLGATCGQVVIEDQPHPALVVEPAGPTSSPGPGGADDAFLPLLIEQGFTPVTDVARLPVPVPGWSVLLAMGQLHAVLRPNPSGGQANAWWQAHQPLPVTDAWRTAANKIGTVLLYAAPAGSIGQQPRENLLREALERAAERGVLVAGAMPPTGI